MMTAGTVTVVGGHSMKCAQLQIWVLSERVRSFCSHFDLCSEVGCFAGLSSSLLHSNLQQQVTPSCIKPWRPVGAICCAHASANADQSCWLSLVLLMLVCGWDTLLCVVCCGRQLTKSSLVAQRVSVCCLVWRCTGEVQWECASSGITLLQ